MLRLTAVLLALATAGCSPLLYVLMGGGGDGGGRIGVGQTVSSSTSGAVDDDSPSCGSTQGGDDESWAFVPPRSGRYRIHVGAEYDSVLAVFGDDGEIACNDDFNSTAESQLELALDAGVAYRIVIDGYHGASGSYDLTVTQLPDEAVIDPPPPVVSTATLEARCQQATVLTPGTLGGTIDPATAGFALSCGANAPGGDVVYAIDVTTPSVVLAAVQSDFDAVLELRAGCQEGHEVIACNDDAPDVHRSEIRAEVQPARYYLIVDSYRTGTGGPFVLELAVTPTAAGPLEPRPPQPTPLETVQ